MRLTVVGAVLAILLAACGSSTSSPAASQAGATGTVAAASTGGAATSASAGASGGGAAAGGSQSGSPTLTGSPAASPAGGTGAASGPFPGGVLVADRGNGRILILDNSAKILWRFPILGSLPAGQQFSADDAFITPDLKRIVANDEFHNVVDIIDIATHRIVWQYGQYGVAGSGPGQLHTPDDAYPLPNGDITVADIFNCRILEIAPDKHIVHTWGRNGACSNNPPNALNEPNGDTPLPDGGILITDIVGSRVIRLAPDGHVVFNIHVPVAYPSDAQLDPQGNVVVADFSTMGQVVAVNPTSGKVVWRWAPRSGPGRLNHPSLATPLANGLVSINDDFRHRLIVVDPKTGKVVWQYGHADVPGRSAGYLNTPDGHEPLPAGFTLPA